MMKVLFFPVLFFSLSFSMDFWSLVGTAKRSIENKAYGHLATAIAKIDSNDFDIEDINFLHDLERGIQEAVKNSKFNELFKVVNFCVDKNIDLNPSLYSKAIDTLQLFREKRVEKYAEALREQVETIQSMVEKEIALRKKVGQFPSPQLTSMNHFLILKELGIKAYIINNPKELGSCEQANTSSGSQNPFNDL